MSECKRCKLRAACKHIPGPFCPWLLYLALAAAVAIPAWLLWQGAKNLNVG
ncbi:MAG: hypothetical protein ACQETD_06090 [Pseudomonadota bacterium]